MTKSRASYTPEEKLKIILDVLGRKTSIQKIAKERAIAPTLISLWKKQAEDAMAARFQPQQKGRKKAAVAVPAAPRADVKNLKNELRKSKIKAAHLESSLRDTKARLVSVEEKMNEVASMLGCRMVKVQSTRRSRKA